MVPLPPVLSVILALPVVMLSTSILPAYVPAVAWKVPPLTMPEVIVMAAVVSGVAP